MKTGPDGKPYAAAASPVARLTKGAAGGREEAARALGNIGRAQTHHQLRHRPLRLGRDRHGAGRLLRLGGAGREQGHAVRMGARILYRTTTIRSRTASILSVSLDAASRSRCKDARRDTVAATARGRHLLVGWSHPLPKGATYILGDRRGTVRATRMASSGPRTANLRRRGIRRLAAMTIALRRHGTCFARAGRVERREAQALRLRLPVRARRSRRRRARAYELRQLEATAGGSRRGAPRWNELSRWQTRRRAWRFVPVCPPITPFGVTRSRHRPVARRKIDTGCSAHCAAGGGGAGAFSASSATGTTGRLIDNDTGRASGRAPSTEPHQPRPRPTRTPAPRRGVGHGRGADLRGLGLGFS